MTSLQRELVVNKQLGGAELKLAVAVQRIAGTMGESRRIVLWRRLHGIAGDEMGKSLGMKKRTDCE